MPAEGTARRGRVPGRCGAATLAGWDVLTERCPWHQRPQGAARPSPVRPPVPVVGRDGSLAGTDRGGRAGALVPLAVPLRGAVGQAVDQVVVRVGVPAADRAAAGQPAVLDLTVGRILTPAAEVAGRAVGRMSAQAVAQRVVGSQPHQVLPGVLVPGTPEVQKPIEVADSASPSGAASSASPTGAAWAAAWADREASPVRLAEAATAAEGPLKAVVVAEPDEMAAAGPLGPAAEVLTRRRSVVRCQVSGPSPASRGHLSARSTRGCPADRSPRQRLVVGPVGTRQRRAGRPTISCPDSAGGHADANLALAQARCWKVCQPRCDRLRRHK